MLSSRIGWGASDGEGSLDSQPGDEVDAERGRELSLSVVGGQDARAGPVDESKREPERSVGGEGGRSERVSGRKLPHSGEQLGESSKAERHADDHLRGRKTGTESVQCQQR